MSVKVLNIEKSKNFGVDNNGTTRYFAVVTFGKGGENKFASSAVGSNANYKLSIDLKGVYGDDKECQTEDGEFKPNSAYKKFKQEYTPEGVNLFDVDLGATYIVQASKRPMSIARIAIYGTEADAKALAMSALKRDLEAHRLVPQSSDTENEDED